MGMVGVQPVDLVTGQFVHNDRFGGDGHQGQRLKFQPVTILVGAGIHAFQLVLNADADFIGLINARLIGDGHALFEDNGVLGTQALGAFVHRGDVANAVAGAAAVVDFVCPQRAAGKAVQCKAGAVIQEYRAGNVNVALQGPGVVFALVLGQGADGIGAGDIGGAAVILAAVIHQQEAARSITLSTSPSAW